MLAYHQNHPEKTRVKPDDVVQVKCKPEQIKFDIQNIQALAAGMLMQYFPHSGVKEVATRYFAPSRQTSDYGEEAWVTREQASREIGQLSCSVDVKQTNAL
jgi:hypothetical protein